MNKIKITCISENTSLHHSLLAQHGQSLHINYLGNQYLFDVGEIYEGFIYNFNQLGLNLNEIKSVIISHKDLDHCGTLPKLLSQLNQSLYLPPDMNLLKENGYISTYRTVNSKSIPMEEIIRMILEYKKAIVVNHEMEIEKGLFITGSLGEGMKEQSLVIKLPDKGIVVIVACSHPTLPVIIEKAKQITGCDKVYGLIGGFHYKGLDMQKINENLDFLSEVNPDFIVPSHCTGYRAIRMLQDKLGEKVHVSGTGQFGTGNDIEILPELVFHLPSK